MKTQLADIFLNGHENTVYPLVDDGKSVYPMDIITGISMTVSENTQSVYLESLNISDTTASAVFSIKYTSPVKGYPSIIYVRECGYSKFNGQYIKQTEDNAIIWKQVNDESDSESYTNIRLTYDTNDHAWVLGTDGDIQENTFISYVCQDNGNPINVSFRPVVDKNFCIAPPKISQDVEPSTEPISYTNTIVLSNAFSVGANGTYTLKQRKIFKTTEEWVWEKSQYPKHWLRCTSNQSSTIATWAKISLISFSDVGNAYDTLYNGTIEPSDSESTVGDIYKKHIDNVTSWSLGDSINLKRTVSYPVIKYIADESSSSLSESSSYTYYAYHIDTDWCDYTAAYSTLTKDTNTISTIYGITASGEERSIGWLSWGSGINRNGAYVGKEQILPSCINKYNPIVGKTLTTSGVVPMSVVTNINMLTLSSYNEKTYTISVNTKDNTEFDTRTPSEDGCIISINGNEIATSGVITLQLPIAIIDGITFYLFSVSNVTVQDTTILTISNNETIWNLIKSRTGEDVVADYRTISEDYITKIIAKSPGYDTQDRNELPLDSFLKWHSEGN